MHRRRRSKPAVLSLGGGPFREASGCALMRERGVVTRSAIIGRGGSPLKRSYNNVLTGEGAATVAMVGDKVVDAQFMQNNDAKRAGQLRDGVLPEDVDESTATTRVRWARPKPWPCG